MAAWRASGAPKKPEVVLCFKDAPYTIGDESELEQVAGVIKFRKETRKLGLELSFTSEDEFSEKIRDYFEKYLNDRYPVTPGKAGAVVAGGSVAVFESAA
ncbi:MAG: hypothetical protein HY820_45945 [Acidobacteria bacterium]|nr:hypothetical protein [Acidobacteriota bacterium]